MFPFKAPGFDARKKVSKEHKRHVQKPLKLRNFQTTTVKAPGPAREQTEFGYKVPWAVDGWEPGAAVQILNNQKYPFQARCVKTWAAAVPYMLVFSYPSTAVFSVL